MEQLALLGGQPTNTNSFPPHNTIGEEEERAVLQVLRSGELSGFVASAGDEFFGGPRVRAVEKRWCERFQVKHAVSMNSATSALYAAVTACGIGPGDEVIIPVFTMTATASAALVNNAVPIFADVDPRTMNITAETIEPRITERTKGIYVTHLTGQTCNMGPILELASTHNLVVLEDGAQSPGAKYKDQYAGCIGDIGVFSLNCHKVIQCGEGGIATTNDDKLALRLQLVRNHGEKVASAFGIDKKDSLIGYNYRMTELQAAVAIEQLKKLDWINKHRIELADHLNKRLAEEIDGIEPPYIHPDCTHVYYIYHLRFSEEQIGMPVKLFAEALRAEGIEFYSGYNVPLYRMPIYQHRSAFGGSGAPFDPPYHPGTVTYDPADFPWAEQDERSSLFTELARWPLTTSDMDLIIDAMKKIIANRDQLLAWSENEGRTANP